MHACRPATITATRRLGAIAATLALLGSACSLEIGEEAEAPRTTPSTTVAEEAPRTTPSSTPETAGEEAETAAEAPASDDCTSVLSVEEINEIFQVSIIEINGGGGFCLVVWADDAVGSMNTFSADDAQMWREANTRKFDEAAAGGVLLEGGERGYITDVSVAAIDDGGRVYDFIVPDSIEIPDGALDRVAEIFLAK